jgi:hypothetical protein
MTIADTITRTYGRDTNGNWFLVTETSYIWLTTLAQVLQLNENESPFYANYGIPAINSIQTQVPPDMAVSRTQSQFASYFASLTVYKYPGMNIPTYNIYALFFDGTIIQQMVT